MKKHIILFLSANPSGSDSRAIDREARAIQVELERSGFRDRFELVTRWAAERLDLLRELRKLKPTVVHFSGHGVPATADEPSNNGCEPRHGLSFQGSDGRPQLVSTAALKETFGAAGSSVKVVVLNACYSDIQAEALLAHVDCVVGMGEKILDDAARNFAIGFYGGLGERESVAAAYKQGRAAISLEGLPDAACPQLKARAGVNANQLIPAAVALPEPVESISRPSRPRDRTRHKKILTVAALGSIFLGILPYASLQARPIAEPGQILLLRVLAAISAAACAAIISDLSQPNFRKVIRVGGALVVSIIVWIMNPPLLIKHISTSSPPNANWSAVINSPSDEGLLQIDAIFASRMPEECRGHTTYNRAESHGHPNGSGSSTKTSKASACRASLDVRIRNGGHTTVNLTQASLSITGISNLHTILERNSDSDTWYAASSYEPSATYQIHIHGEASALEWLSMSLKKEHPSELKPLVKTIPVAHVLKPGEVDNFIIEVSAPFPKVKLNASLSLTYNGALSIASAFKL